MNKKIDLYINGNYVCSTNAFPSCKDFVQHVKNQKYLVVACSPTAKRVNINPTDKIIAHYDKR